MTTTNKKTKPTTKKTDDNLEQLLKENLALDEKLQDKLPSELKKDFIKGETDLSADEPDGALTQVLDSIEADDSAMVENSANTKDDFPVPLVKDDSSIELEEKKDLVLESNNLESTGDKELTKFDVGSEIIKNIIPPEALKSMENTDKLPEGPIERPLEEVKKEAEEVKKELEKEKKEIEAHMEDVGTLASAAQVQQAQQTKTPEMVKVEGVLQDGLKDYFLKMTPNEQENFKIEGERVASKIVILLKAAKVKVVKILKLITQWLKMIPGVNKYYLEQQSKIKTDNLIRMKEEGEFDGKM